MSSPWGVHHIGKLEPKLIKVDSVTWNASDGTMTLLESFQQCVAPHVAPHVMFAENNLIASQRTSSMCGSSWPLTTQKECFISLWVKSGRSLENLLNHLAVLQTLGYWKHCMSEKDTQIPCLQSTIQVEEIIHGLQDTRQAIPGKTEAHRTPGNSVRWKSPANGSSLHEAIENLQGSDPKSCENTLLPFQPTSWNFCLERKSSLLPRSWPQKSNHIKASKAATENNAWSAQSWKFLHETPSKKHKQIWHCTADLQPVKFYASWSTCHPAIRKSTKIHDICDANLHEQSR